MKKTLIILLLLLPSLVIKAQLSQKVNRHFIIAVDNAMPKYTAVAGATSTVNYIDHVLNDYFEITDSDYVSIVTYQVDLANPNFDNFAWIPYDRNSRKIAWRRLEEKSLTQFGNWANIATYQHSKYCEVSIHKASFQSGAKPYILSAVKAKGNTCANETYILMLSDEKVNGTDDNYSDEWNQIAVTKGGNNAKMKRCKDAVFNKLKKTNRLFQFEQQPFWNEEQHVFAHIDSKPLVLVVYKVRPTVIPSLPSVTNMPSPLPFKRVRGGYAFDLKLDSTNTWSVKKMQVVLEKGDTVNNLSASWNKKLNWSQLSAGDSTIFKAWVKYNDGVYNGVMVNPYDDLYAQGMTVRGTVTLADDAKVFGILPLWDLFWWWFPNDIVAAVHIWDFILLLIFIAVIAYIGYKVLYRITSYYPSNDKIKITSI